MTGMNEPMSNVGLSATMSMSSLSSSCDAFLTPWSMSAHSLHRPCSREKRDESHVDPYLFRMALACSLQTRVLFHFI
jgi:hypothetical protein